MQPARYHCLVCDERFDQPSISDASSERIAEDGSARIVRTHLLLCPECFSPRLERLERTERAA